MSRAFPRERKKCDMNSVPRSEVTWAGTPCLEKMCNRKSRANSGEVMVSWVGMKTACFERRSVRVVPLGKTRVEGLGFSSCAVPLTRVRALDLEAALGKHWRGSTPPSVGEG